MSTGQLRNKSSLESFAVAVLAQKSAPLQTLLNKWPLLILVSPIKLPIGQCVMHIKLGALS